MRLLLPLSLEEGAAKLVGSSEWGWGWGGGQTLDWGLQSTTVCDFMGQVESPILKQTFGVNSSTDVITSYESRWVMT